MFIELNTFLKKCGVASSGGQAKFIIRSGEVLLNGAPETQNRKKLKEGDIVKYQGKEFVVKP